MPAYTFRAVGSSTSGTNAPAMPTGWQVGDLLLLVTTARLSSETLADPAGWTRLADTTSTTNDSLILFGRIAESGDAGPSLDWSGTSSSRHQIAAFYGDIETNLSAIVAHDAAAGSTSSAANLPNPALTVTTDDCLIVGVGRKQKTVTSDGATVTSPSGLNNRISLEWINGSNVGLVWDYTQQATAANISASVWDQSIEESMEYASLIVALKTAASTIPYFQYQSRLNPLLRM